MYNPRRFTFLHNNFAPTAEQIIKHADDGPASMAQGNLEPQLHSSSSC